MALGGTLDLTTKVRILVPQPTFHYRYIETSRSCGLALFV